MNTVDIIANDEWTEFDILITPTKDYKFSRSHQDVLASKIKLNPGMAMAIAQAIEKVVGGEKKRVSLTNMGIEAVAD